MPISGANLNPWPENPAATIAVTAAAQQSHDRTLSGGNLPTNQLIVWLANPNNPGGPATSVAPAGGGGAGSPAVPTPAVIAAAHTTTEPSQISTVGIAIGGRVNPEAGNLALKALSTAGVLALATATGAGAPPTAAIALCVADELAALA